MNKAILPFVLLLVFLQGCSKNLYYKKIDLRHWRKIAESQIKLLPKEAEISGNLFYAGTVPFEAIYKKNVIGYEILFFDPFMRQIGQIMYNGSEINYKFVQNSADRYLKFFKPFAKRFDSLLFAKIVPTRLNLKQEGDYILFSDGTLNYKMDIKKIVLRKASNGDITLKYDRYSDDYNRIWIAKRIKIFQDGIESAELILREVK